jgi:hypothetical protein
LLPDAGRRLARERADQRLHVRRVAASIEAMLFGPAGPGSFVLVPLEANGAPGFAC